MSLLNERSTVRSPLIRNATEGGWTYLSPEEALRLWRGETGLILHVVLVQRLQRLNPCVVDAQKAEEVVRGLVSV
ncbi:MAG: hypothetical protein ACUVV5_12845 [Candidatus Aminicenantales bacterium]